MTYLFDSREKKNAHVKAYFDKHGLPYKIAKLDVGDYMLDGGHVSVDHKQNLSELATNLMNAADKSRFWREVRRAREQGITLIVLCEHGGKIKSVKDVPSWNSKYSPVTGRALMGEMYRLSVSYGVRFEFCDKRSTGRRIAELLWGEQTTK